MQMLYLGWDGRNINIAFREYVRLSSLLHAQKIMVTVANLFFNEVVIMVFCYLHMSRRSPGNSKGN